MKTESRIEIFHLTSLSTVVVMSIQWKVPCSVCLICKNVLIKDGRPIHSPRPVHSTKLKARGKFMSESVPYFSRAVSTHSFKL